MTARTSSGSMAGLALAALLGANPGLAEELTARAGSFADVSVGPAALNLDLSTEERRQLETDGNLFVDRDAIGYRLQGGGYRWTAAVSADSVLETRLSWRWAGRNLSLHGQLQEDDPAFGEDAFARTNLFAVGDADVSKLTLTISR